jgi:hypothetical protein
MATYTLPRAFVWRRVHSLMGLWLALFLTEHLLTNSQAALLLGDNGGGFVRTVNWIHDLPYLQVIEVFLIGTPILMPFGVLSTSLQQRAMLEAPMEVNPLLKSIKEIRLTPGRGSLRGFY